MKILPKSLQNLYLDLSYNNLGNKADDWKYLRDLIKYLPNNLLSFNLNLAREKVMDMESLT